jgi:rhodanese-related sulfurtransferase
MKASGRTIPLWLVSGIFGAGLLPILLYWFFFLREPSLTVDAARSLLAQTNSSAVLVDVRSPEAFAAGHVAGAVNWSSKSIRAVTGPPDVPAALRGRKLLVMDDGTWRGAQAAMRLREIAGLELLNVAGGMPAWETVLNGKPSALHARQMSLSKQWLAVATGFAIKPTHMVLCLALIIWLWPQRAPDLAALRWG